MIRSSKFVCPETDTLAADEFDILQYDDDELESVYMPNKGKVIKREQAASEAKKNRRRMRD